MHAVLITLKISKKIQAWSATRAIRLRKSVSEMLLTSTSFKPSIKEPVATFVVLSWVLKSCFFGRSIAQELAKYSFFKSFPEFERCTCWPLNTKTTQPIKNKNKSKCPASKMISAHAFAAWGCGAGLAFAFAAFFFGRALPAGSTAGGAAEEPRNTWGTEA